VSGVIRVLLWVQIAGSAFLAVVDDPRYWPLVALGCLGWFTAEMTDARRSE
jgi:hypothetical protein